MGKGQPEAPQIMPNKGLPHAKTQTKQSPKIKINKYVLRNLKMQCVFIAI